MDNSEELANKFLLTKFKSVVFEPDGNIPPDFLADGKIAVEVRRLNQNEVVNGRNRGLEEVSIPLSAKVSKLLESLGAPVEERSFWVSFRFRRPHPKWRTLKYQIREILLSIPDLKNDTNMTFEFGRNFKIEIRPTDFPKKHRFVLANYTDHDSGGWVLAEMKKNIECCIDEKTKKIAPYKSKYAEWWLILIDFIGYGLNEADQYAFRQSIQIPHSWDKVILIDPRNHLRTMLV